MMAERRTILVGFDARDESKDALGLGSVLASGLGADLTVAHVVTPPPPDVELAVPGTGGRLLDQARVAVSNEISSTTVGAELRVPVVSASSPARGLYELAESEDASLVAIGSTHRALLRSVEPGSVANRLVMGAPCPVAVAPRGWPAQAREALRTVGVGWCEDAESNSALRLAAQLAAQLDATVAG